LMPLQPVGKRRADDQVSEWRHGGEG
jgi:hypothetical protein